MLAIESIASKFFKADSLATLTDEACVGSSRKTEVIANRGLITVYRRDSVALETPLRPSVQ